MCCARSSKKYPKNTGGSNGSLQSVPVVDIVSVYLSIYLSICLSLSLSIHPYIHPSIDLSIYAKKKNESQVLQKEISGLLAIHPPEAPSQQLPAPLQPAGRPYGSNAGDGFR